MQQSVENWKIGFRRIVTAIRAHAPNVAFMWCPSLGYDALGDTQPGGPYTFEMLYPGDESVDYIGFGAYDYNLNITRYTQDNSGRLERWNDNWVKPNGFSDLITCARAHNKKLAHVEWGLWPQDYLGQQGGGDDDVYIAKVAEYIRNYGVRLSIYNNSTAEHRLSTYPLAKATYQQEFMSL